MAFLEGDINETIFINLPEGVKTEENKVGKLNKAMYGLVQAAWQFYFKIIQFMTNELNFKKCQTDACLLKVEGIVIGLYVDDLIIIGPIDKITFLIEKFKSKFNLRINETVEAFIWCEFTWNSTNNSVGLHQTKIIYKLETAFGEEVKQMKEYTTPGGTGIIIEQISESDPPIVVSKQKISFGSGNTAISGQTLSTIY